MATVTKGAQLSFGVVSCVVNVLGAVETPPRNVTVCAGDDGPFGKGLHAPARVNQRWHCPECGEVPYTQLAKAREVPEGLVVLTEEDLESAGADAATYKKRIDLTPHPAGQVDVHTAPGGKAYFLVPVAGHEEKYTVLAGLVAAHPELAFCTRWTPRTSMGVFRLATLDGPTGPVLLMQERVAGDKVRALPEVAGPGANHDRWLTVMEAMLGGMGGDPLVTDFDLTEYRNRSEDAIAAIVAERTALPALVAAGSTPRPAGEEQLAALEAQMAALASTAVPATKPPRPTRKRAVKKEVA